MKKIDPTNERKLRHIRAIEAHPETDRRKFHFDDIRLKHRALPEVNLKDVDPSTFFMGKKLSFPLLISSMTGGDHELIKTINRNLATAAEATGVALAVGSQRVMFSEPAARASFELRSYAPTAMLFSNLGAIQLNNGFTVELCREAIEVVGADALYFHLNPLQEAVQTNGDTNFQGLAEKLQDIDEQLDEPVVLKEVGAGFSVEDLQLLLAGSIQYIDVAGSGGTSWSRIEYHSQTQKDKTELGLTFEDWGVPTPEALIALRPYRERFTFIASGGIRSGIDMVKAMILGASLCGMASPFLKPAMESPEKTIDLIERIKRDFVTAMFLLGMPDVASLTHNEALLLTRLP
ncbi:MAG TPA: type 2 isopentenyl-diphosphate Delta-isomerase [Verrucomicrobia bacterium]|nr:MAG: type 2 isopentenyl-diphosphate Delta-isomerase [Lentisphaerae bacterium GWF2_57_35]HBA85170.1 type 2 isopentenyl-diphosphate Delta-isomerase [Verrucomicrobiota bacterium]